MHNLSFNIDPKVKYIFDNYPEMVRPKMELLRKIIIETAQETEDVLVLEETLKWGEPSYLSKNGSTIRIDWKSKSPDQYAMYFQCTSKLIPTFKMIYQDVFKYEGSRALLFKLDDNVPVPELQNCIAAALTYHKVKHLPSLAM